MRPLLRVENLVKHYAATRFGEPRTKFTALHGISLTINSGETLALVGESGSGKSTLARCIACLESPTEGSIWFEERELTKLKEAEKPAIRPQIQLVFQDPVQSLNPRWTALDIVSEPFMIQHRISKAERNLRSRILLERVGIPEKLANRRVNEFSGGQRQRLAIGRALALEPKLILLDEALSALDCSVQARIANLLLELQSSLGVAYLFITHDFGMAAHFADEIAVMQSGRIVESGPAAKISRSPDHQITRSLIGATPRMQKAPAATVEA